MPQKLLRSCSVYSNSIFLNLRIKKSRLIADALTVVNSFGFVILALNFVPYSVQTKLVQISSN